MTVPLIAPHSRHTATASTRWTCASARSCGSAGRGSNLSLDIVNLFNSNDNLAYQTLLSPTWPAPTQVLLPRIFRVNFGIDW